jgi:hypothetical protein
MTGLQVRKLAIPADEGYGAGGFPAWVRLKASESAESVKSYYLTK